MPRGELVPVIITTLSLTLLPAVFDSALCPRSIGEEEGQGENARSSGVPRYAAYSGYVLESAWVGGLDDELLAKSLETLFGDRCHAGIFEGIEELFVLVGRHLWCGRTGQLRGC